MLQLISLGLLIVCMALHVQGQNEVNQMTYLVASASANTGSKVVQELADRGLKVRALLRKPESDLAKTLAELPGVDVMAGDFDDAESISRALQGVDRALLVTPAFDFRQFDRETAFLSAAKDANVELVVRIGTATGLMAAHSTSTYGRAHHGIEAYSRAHAIPVVHLRSNWFFDNWLLNAEEAKTSGKISYPVEGFVGGTGKGHHWITTQDVASAAAVLLTVPPSKLNALLAEQVLEVHGEEVVNFEQKAKALSKSVGYEITVNPIPASAMIQGLVGFGFPHSFARSFAETVAFVAGEKPPVQPQPAKTSAMLLELGYKPKHSVTTWAEFPYVKAAFSRASSKGEL